MAHNDPDTTSRPSPVSSFGSGVADPGPLGLAAFAATTFFLSAVNADLLPKTVETGVLPLALFFGGIVQLLAGMWEFAKGNTFGALAFSSFGAFWLSFWYLLHTVVPGWVATKVPVNDIDHAVGTYLLVWTVFTAYMLIAAIRVSVAIMAVFAVLALTFLFLTIGNYAGSTSTIKIGGYLGLATAVLAWYGSFAGVTNATFKKVILPVLPR